MPRTYRSIEILRYVNEMHVNYNLHFLRKTSLLNLVFTQNKRKKTNGDIF